VALTRTDRGLTVVTERMESVRSVALGFWVGIGSVDETDRLAGASHFLEHLLFKGTSQRSARDIAEAVDAVGGDMNAFTTKEYTAFYIRVLSADAPLAVDVLSDIIWQPAFRPDEVESERQVILEEILMHADEPAEAVHDLAAGAVFPSHPLGREVLGTPDTIAAMARDDIAAFHHGHYQPANMVVAAAGDVDHDRLVAELERRAGDHTGGALPRRHAPAVPPAAVAVDGRDTEQAHLVVAMPAPHRNDDDRFALTLVDHILGGGMSSRLFQSVREERGLAYSVYSYRSAFEAGGALAVYAGTAPARVPEVLEVIDDELDRMAAKGPTDAELDAARSHIRGATALGLEDSGANMSRIGRAQLIHGEVLSVEAVDARLAALTPADVRQVAARVVGAPRTLAVVGPFSEGDFSR
jgi:predicted Zn-dependent peptidase